MNTIYALCSGKVPAGLAVFRISGPSALKVLSVMVNKNIENLESRKNYYGKIYTDDKKIIDDGMYVYFKNPHSFTGEDTVELYLHGSIAVCKMMTGFLERMPDLRAAEAGEFARRAFLNGKMDLTSAEGLADLIDAQTSMQHYQAIRQLGGGLNEIYEKWRKDLLKIYSLLEAYIDFPDEEIPESALNESNLLIEKLKNDFLIHLDDGRRGEILRQGIKLAIIGRPNVGKSSLLNKLVQRELAIVSDIAGTTRDIIEGHLDIGGYPIIIQDTAGIRDQSDDTIEIEGIRRARATGLDADIRIIMLDLTIFNHCHKDDYVRIVSEQISGLGTSYDKNCIILLNKMDKTDKDASHISDIKLNIAHYLAKFDINPEQIICTCIKTGENMDKLLNMVEKIASNVATPTNCPLITRERHRAQIQKSLDILQDFSFNNDLVLAAEDLRICIRYLSNITGHITVDEILGEIFSSFCIGK